MRRLDQSRHDYALHTLLIILGLFLLCADVSAAINPALILASDSEVDDGFGESVSISNDTAIVGAPYNDDAGLNSGSAYIFKRDSSGVWLEQEKILANDAGALDQFGTDVALSGDVALIGAQFDSDKGSSAGAAYIFRRDSITGVWTQEAKLTAADGSALAYFGNSVALYGETALIGANGDTVFGAAYVFSRDAAGNWNQEAKLTGERSGAGGNNLGAGAFGSSVALDMNIAVIGAPYEAGVTLNNGAAYIFARNSSGIWERQARLFAADGGGGQDFFSHSVSISQKTVLIGAYDSNQFGISTGAVYLYEGDDAGNWSFKRKLLPDDGAAGDRFGYSTSISGDTVLIAAPDDDEKGSNSGSVYVYKRDAAGDWSGISKINTTDNIALNSFGMSVDLAGSSVFIGAQLNGAAAVKTGSVYVIDDFFIDSDGDGVMDYEDLYPLDSAEWIDSDGDGVGNNADADDDNDGVLDSEDAFPLDPAESQDIDGDGIGDGIDADLDNDGIPNAVEYLFGLNSLDSQDAGLDLDGDGYDNLAEYHAGTSLTDPDESPATVRALHNKLISGEYDSFGKSVAVSGHELLIGGGLEAAYSIIRDSSGQWGPPVKLMPVDFARGDSFGYSVSLDGDTALIGARTNHLGVSPYAGSTYVFVRDSANGKWTQQAELWPDKQVMYFGNSVSVSGDLALVGTGTNVAYVFKRDANMIWAQEARLELAGLGNSYGDNVALDGNTAIIGVSSQDKVYVVVRDVDGTWSLQAEISTPGNSDAEYFGYSVALDGDSALIGAYWPDNNVSQTGTAYLYQRNNAGEWMLKTELKALGLEVGDGYGASVALGGNRAMVGATGDDGQDYNSGAAYLFIRDNNGNWSKQGRLRANDGGWSDGFGHSVAVSDSVALVGTAGRNIAYSFTDISSDSDGDGFLDISDNCLSSVNSDQVDTDGDGDGNVCDADDDNDGVLDIYDALPLDPMESVDTDRDGIGNNADNDDDGDGIPDPIEIAIGLDPLDSVDARGDLDNDGYSNAEEYRAGTSLTDSGQNPGILAAIQYKIFSKDRSLFFGYSVAIYGDTALIGAESSDAAYVYVRDGSNGWKQQAKLVPEVDVTSGSFESFGYAVSIWKDTAVIGSGTSFDTGAAYVFARDSAGNWVQQARLTGVDSRFGASVNVAEDAILVGAPGGSFGGAYSGNVYVFERDTSGAWTQKAIILPVDGDRYDEFGASISFSGNTALIGAPLDDDSGEDSGSAYIFAKNQSGVWTQQGKLLAIDGVAGGHFGAAVSVSGNTAVVGSPLSGINSETGAAYVFERTAEGDWLQKAKLSVVSGSYFGSSVSAMDDAILVGQRFALNGGAAYLFGRDSMGSWINGGKLTARDGSDYFGFSVALSGGDAVIGAIHDGDLGYGTGATYVFEGVTNDSDNDGIFNFYDNCIDVVNTDQIDTDVDQLGDACDTDDDNDGVLDINDAFPLNALESLDNDGDGIGDNSDSDDDEDGIPDLVEIKNGLDPLDYADAVTDMDSDGYTNIEEYLAGSSMILTEEYPELPHPWHYKIVPGDASERDWFGSDVSISGDMLLVGAPRDDDNGYESGAAYIFKRTTTGLWQQQAKLLAADGMASDLFGSTVVLHGDTALVGAIGADIGGVYGAGAVYVFTRNADGKWSQEAKLYSADITNKFAAFGSALALEGDTALIAAYQEAVNGLSGSGAVYVFKRNSPGGWSQQEKLLPDDAVVGDNFGSSIALNANTALIGSTWADGWEENSGAAYVFVRDNNEVWSQQAKLFPGESVTGFGISVSVSGDYALIRERGPSAFIFVRDNSGSWLQQENLAVDNIYSQLESTVDVAIKGVIAIVGSANAGFLYVFEQDAFDHWVLRARLRARDGADSFSAAVSLERETIAIGAPFDDDSGVDSGSVYVFENYRDDYDDDGSWNVSDNCVMDPNSDQLDTDADGQGDVCDNDDDGDGVEDKADAFPLDGSETSDADGDGVGDIADLDDDNDGIPDTFEVMLGLDPLDSRDGAEDLDGDGYNNAAEYQMGTAIDDMRIHPGMLVTETYQKLLASGGEIGDHYGSSVAIHGNLALVGAPDRDGMAGEDSGAVYVYERDSGDIWQPLTIIEADDGMAGDHFGRSIAFDGNTALIGSPFASVDAVQSGAVYVFTYDPVTALWSQQGKLVSPVSTTYQQFGQAVSLFESMALVGAHGDDNYRGAAYIFERVEDTWSLSKKLVASNGDYGDIFGFSVALADKTAVIGAFNTKNGTDIRGSGSAYIFTNSAGSGWQEEAVLTAPGPVRLSYFGMHVSLSVDTVLIGAILDNDYVGSVYAFTRGVDGLWSEVVDISPDDGDSGDQFGGDFAFNGNTAVIGAINHSEYAAEIGAAYMFVRNADNKWLQIRKFTSDDGEVLDSYGVGIALDGQTLLVGVAGDDDNGDNSGSAYIYDFSFLDIDEDGHIDVLDNCPELINSEQLDGDGDGFGDVCDAFPYDVTEWLDTDGDGIGNNADTDDDGDGIEDKDDSSPLVANILTPVNSSNGGGVFSVVLLWALWGSYCYRVRREVISLARHFRH